MEKEREEKEEEMRESLDKGCRLARIMYASVLAYAEAYDGVKVYELAMACCCMLSGIRHANKAPSLKGIMEAIEIYDGILEDETP